MKVLKYAIKKQSHSRKLDLQHGEWGKWLEEKVEFTDRTAQKFMKVASEISNSQTYSNLTQSKVFALLDLPQDQRQGGRLKLHP